MRRVKSKEVIPCPICGHRLKIIGSRVRKYIDADEIKKTLNIRRYRCVSCKKIHHELPDILIPYKRHCADTIEKVINDKAHEVNVEENTSRKIISWWKALFSYLINILNTLSVKYQVTYEQDLAPRKIIRVAVNANMCPHTRSAWKPG
jgi:DNA-directed RNA polymerase subunit RPC12/RpoP